MKRSPNPLIRFFDLLYRAAVVLAGAMLVAMVAITGVNVFMRYVLNTGLRWGEELALVLVIWFSFIAMAIGVRRNLHISIHLFRNPNRRVDRALNMLKALVAVFVGAVMFWYGNIIIRFMSRSILPATELPSSVMYAVLPLASTLIIYEGIADLFGFDADDSEGPGAADDA